MAVAVVTVRWNGPMVHAAVRKRIMAGIHSATGELWKIALTRASIANTGVKVKLKRKRTYTTKTGKTRNKTSRTIYPNPSLPGQAPRRRTGHGQRNIRPSYLPAKLTGYVGHGANARYMSFHEVGINYRRKGRQVRPTLVPALLRNLPRLRAAFIAGMRRGG